MGTAPNNPTLRQFELLETLARQCRAGLDSLPLTRHTVVTFTERGALG